MMVKALRHPCEELRDLALTEIEKFRMPKEEVAARLVDLANPESAGAFPWYIHQAGIQSLGKLQVKTEAVISTLVRIGFDRSEMWPVLGVVEEAVRAIKTLREENSDTVAARVVELLHGTPEDQQFVWITVIKSVRIEHPRVIAELRETMGSNLDVNAYLDRFDDIEPEPEPEPEMDAAPEAQAETSSAAQQIAETRSKLTSLGSALTDPGTASQERIDDVTEMMDVVNSVLPGVMTDAKELLTQGGELLTKLCDVGNNDDIGAVLCWTTQEIAVTALLQDAVGGSPSDEAQQSLARIIAFESSLRKQSTLVLGIAGIALPPVVADDDGYDGDESGSSADEGSAVDPFVEQLLGRLERSCPFAFSPLLHYFRAVLDPGTDPNGERSDALRERVAGRLQEIGPHSLEAMFLRKELQVG
jgi:hypothetical protein